MNVTIIISNYNYGQYILRALGSALNQTYQCNIVVVDDGSTDDSIKKIKTLLNERCQLTSLSNDKFSTSYYSGPIFIQEYKHKNKYVKLIKIDNSGASTARNVGIWNSWDDSDVFAILDADDIYHPTKVEKLVKVMKEYKEIGVAYADYCIVRPKYKKIEHKEYYSPQRLKQECIIHSGALIKKEYLKQVMLPNQEFYDSNLHCGASKGFIGCTEDYDLWLRLCNKCMIVHLPELLSEVYELGHNQSLKMTPEIFKKNIEIINGRN